jgi:hypothetical protein
MAPLLQEAADSSRLTFQDVAAVAPPGCSSSNSCEKDAAAAVAPGAGAGASSPHAALQRLLQMQPESPPDDVQKLSLAKRGSAGFYSGGAGSMLYARYKVVQSK